MSLTATTAAMAAAAILTVAAPASAGPDHLGGGSAQPGHQTGAAHFLHLRAMPHGIVAFSRKHRHITAHVTIYGLTPGSSHAVQLAIPRRRVAHRFRLIGFSTLTANSVGQAKSVLGSHFTGRLPRGSRLVIRMGTGQGRISREPIAITKRLRHPGHRPHRLIAVDISPGGISYGTPRGRATLRYNSHRRTLTVTVHANGITPGPHAAHIHLGSCQSQGPVLYMLRDLVANSRGVIRHAVRVLTAVTKPIPARGWYLNIHQGNSSDILSGGQPTILFRPLLCRNIHG